MPPVRRLHIANAAKRGQAERAGADPAPARKPTATKTVTRPATRVTRVSVHEGSRDNPPTQEGQEQENLGRRTVAVDRQAKVRYGAGLTLNLGNYESARIDVQVELPCDVDGVDEALDEAIEFVSTRLTEEEQRWTSR